MGKHDDLLAFARDELKKAERGEVPAVSTLNELAERFGLAYIHTSRLLAQAGLATRRLELQREERARRRSALLQAAKDRCAGRHLTGAEFQALADELGPPFGFTSSTARSYLKAQGLRSNHRSRRRLDRRDEFTTTVMTELDAYNRGDRVDITALADMADHYGLSLTAAQGVLFHAGIAGQRDEVERSMARQRWRTLFATVERELEEMTTGVRDRLSSNEELAERFGFAAATVGGRLGENGLAGRRQDVELSRRAEMIQPSPDLTWFIGCLSFGGSVRLPLGHMVLRSRHPELLIKFRNIGERLLDIAAHISPAAGSERAGILFASTVHARHLGDLSRAAWAETVRAKHAWIMRRHEYMWRFVEAAVETRGTFSTCSGNYRLHLYTPSLPGALFLLELLAQVGIKGARLLQHRGSISAVAVYRLDELKCIASHIHSCRPVQQVHLARIRTQGHHKGSPVRSIDQLVEA